ncbi:hypothetical protein CSUI_006277 [Cystoisospora suis]|uniref:Transmembrane protein n=1 Tax=Cystoisospora suis TaxID=483139 RepID=A0A2C6KQW8_9APIC|nr:hypothetical protein CSUI_006277 [Cystoisospora suis]
MMATRFFSLRLHPFLRLQACSLLLFLAGTVEISQNDAAALTSAAWRTPAAMPDRTNFAGLEVPAVGNPPAADDGGPTTADEALSLFEDARNHRSTGQRFLHNDEEEESPTESLSASRPSKQPKGATRGSKISARTLMAILGVTMALAGTIALLSRRKRWSADVGEAVKPAGEPGRERARKKASMSAEKKTQAGASVDKSGQPPPVLKDTLVPLHGPGITDKEQSVVGAGSPAVQKVEEEVRRVMEEILDVSPSLYVTLEERLEALEAGEAQEFEENFCRLISVAQRAQLMVLDDKVSKLERDVHDGIFSGHHALLVNQLESHHAFLRSAVESIDVNGRRAVVLLEDKYSQDKHKAGSLTAFVNEETKTLETLAFILERRLALLRIHTGFNGKFVEGLEEKATSGSADAKREADEAVRKMEGLVSADIPPMYAGTWT